MKTRFVLALILTTAVACSGKDNKPVANTTARTAQAPTAPILMKGMYSYMADAGTFTPCGTEKKYPVAMEADNAALERAYSEASSGGGAPMFVTLHGHFDARPPMEGRGTRETLIVDHFMRVWPDETCMKADVQTTLDNTYWKLVELEGVPVNVHEDQREPHLLLRAGENRVGGFAGCNSLAGNYTAKGDSLSFGKLASTLMACPYLSEEQAFMGVLGRVKTYVIQGESLDLRDENGSIALFRAVYMR